MQNNRDLDDTLVEAVRQRIARAHYQRSRLALRGKPGRQAMAKALAGFEEAVRWDGRDARYRYELAMCRYRMGDLAGAAADFTRGLALGGATPEMRYFCVLAHLRQGDSAGALDLLAARDAESEPAIPRWAWARLHALALATADRTEEALKHLDREETPPEVWWADILALARSVEPAGWLHDWLAEQHGRLAGPGTWPEAEKIAGLLGDVAEGLGRAEEAVKYRLAAGGGSVARVVATLEDQALAALSDRDHAGAVQACRRALDARPGDPVITELLAIAEVHAGNALWQEGRREEAVEAWLRSSGTRKSVSAARNLAVVCELAEDWREAGEWWRQAGDLARAAGDPEGAAGTATRRAMALARLGKAAEAVKALRQVKDPPADPGLRRIQGFICLLAGDVEGALGAFEAAQAQHPTDPQLALGRALAVDLGGRTPEEKAESWKRVLALRPHDEAGARWRQHSLEAGMRAWKAGKLKEAMQTFASLLLHNRKDAEGWIWCGLLHLQQGNELAARDCLEEAIRVRPDSAEMLVKVGGCHLLIGRREEARSFFNQALELDPAAATELLIAETGFENKWPELAFERLQSGMRLCDARTPELPLILRLVIRFGDASKTLSVLNDALEVTSGHPRIYLLVAVFQHIRAGAWREAQEALDRIAVDGAAGDPVLAAAANQVSQALILLRTVGSADQREFDQAVEQVIDSWVLEQSPPEPDLATKCQAWAREELEAILQGGAETELALPETELPSPRLRVEEERFGQALEWRRGWRGAARPRPEPPPSPGVAREDPESRGHGGGGRLGSHLPRLERGPHGHPRAATRPTGAARGPGIP